MPATASTTASSSLESKTSEELLARQRLLESEIEANEEENRAYQSELDKVYAEQDRRRGDIGYCRVRANLIPKLA